MRFLCQVVKNPFLYISYILYIPLLKEFFIWHDFLPESFHTVYKSLSVHNSRI